LSERHGSDGLLQLARWSIFGRVKMPHATIGRVLLVGAMASLGGCHGGSGAAGSGSVTGTLLGRPFSVSDAASTSGQVVTNRDIAKIVLFEGATGVCAQIAAGEQMGGVRTIEIEAGVYDLMSNTSKAPTAPGVFTVPFLTSMSGNTADVHYDEDTPDCVIAMRHDGVSGGVTLSSVDQSGYSGSGDVTFDNGDHVTFTFRAPTCAAAENPPPLRCVK